jgi:hypothetical protein
MRMPKYEIRTIERHDYFQTYWEIEADTPEEAIEEMKSLPEDDSKHCDYVGLVEVEQIIDESGEDITKKLPPELLRGECYEQSYSDKAKAYFAFVDEQIKAGEHRQFDNREIVAIGMFADWCDKQGGFPSDIY